MSGFAGIVCTDGATPDRGLLERMANGLAFRGPDATHIWSQAGAGFCFTFLQTGPGPQSSEQPCSLDGRVWLIGDVRLDGRAELRRELKQDRNGIPVNATDEELILRTWQQWGERGFERFIGDFSFVLWDGVARQLWCVRDLMGARPFFYLRLGDWLCFSNTLEVLRLIPGVSAVLDPQFIGDFLLQECSGHVSRTVYRDVHRLPPGHQLRFFGGELNVRRFAEFPIEEPLQLKREEEYVEQFRDLLERAVSDRVPQGPSAVFLSGGLDSTSVAAIVARTRRKSEAPGALHAYTVDSQAYKDQEGFYASLAAQHLRISIEMLSADSCLPYQAVNASGQRTPEPIHDPFLALSNLQYLRVSARARVAFTGYGGDDVLTGQAWPYLVYLAKRSRFGAIGKAFGGYLLRYRRIPSLRGGFRARLRRWMGGTDPISEIPSWLQEDFLKQTHLRERWRENHFPPKTRHPLHPIAYAGLCGESWSGMFETEDAAWTSVAVEMRAPLLDQRLLRFLLRLPPVPWCMEKRLLREAMRGVLPEEIRVRPKTPLNVEPIDHFVESNQWSPFPLPPPSKEMRLFVDWERLNATLAEARGSKLWAGLRALSLHYWLKGVENR